MPDLPLTGETIVGVVGAGAMGAGIAQVALLQGHRVLLTDARYPAVLAGRATIEASLQREVERGRLLAESATSALSRLQTLEPHQGVGAFGDWGLASESIAFEGSSVRLNLAEAHRAGEITKQQNNLNVRQKS